MDIIIRSSTSDENVYRHIFKEGYYNFDLLSKINFDPKVILDCGAYTGISTLFFYEKYKNAKVIAIEPEKDNFEYMLRNTSFIKDGRVVCINAAVWNKSEKLKVVKDLPEYAKQWSYESKWHYMVSNNLMAGDESVNSVTINELIHLYEIETIDILKLDIEGSEKYLLESNNQWLNKTKVIMVEFHDRKIPGCEKAMLDAMLERNIRYYRTLKKDTFLFINLNLVNCDEKE